MKPKQLIWIDGRAETPFGAYRIECSPHVTRKLTPIYVIYLTCGSVCGHFSDKTKAIAAAQADFDRRWRECCEHRNENDSLHTDGLTEADLIGGDN